jgi:hypothetical protein
MRRAARAHAIFCMNLEEAAKSAFREDGREMLGLKARAGEPRHPIRWKAESARLSNSKSVAEFLVIADPCVPVAFIRLIWLHRGQRAMLPVWEGNGRAGATANELPRVALEIDR